MNRVFIILCFIAIQAVLPDISVGQCSVSLSVQTDGTICQFENLVLQLTGVSQDDSSSWYMDDSANAQDDFVLVSSNSLLYEVSTVESNTISFFVIVNDTCVTDTIDVTIFPTSDSGILSISASQICSGDSLELFVANQNGDIMWETSSDGQFFDSSEIFGGSFNSGAIFNNGSTAFQRYYRTVVSNEFCSPDTSEVLSVTIYPNANYENIDLDTTEICSGQSVNGNISGAIGSIQWKTSSNNIVYNNIPNATNSSLITNNLINSGSSDQTIYFFAFLTSGVCAALSTDTLEITVHPKPSIPDPQNIEICSGDFFEFAPVNGGAFTIPAQTLYTYTFTDNTNVSGESEGVELTNVSAELVSSQYAQQTVVYNVIPSSDGCLGNAFLLSVNLKPAPNLIANADMAVCEGESAQLFAIDLFNIDNTYFDWTGSEQLGSLNFPYISNPTVSPDSTAIYIVQMFDPMSGCNAVDSVVVTVGEWPQFSLIAPSIICGDETVEIQIVGADNLQIDASVQGGNLEGVSNQNVSVSTDSSDELLVTVIGENLAGCVTTLVESIEVGQLPNSSISGPNVVCANSFYQEYSVASTANFLNWQVQNGEIMNGQGTNEIMVHWFDGDGGSLSLNESAANSGCSNLFNYSVSFDGLAPNLEQIVLLAANQPILYCVNSSFEIYQWGYTTASTNQDFYTGGSSQYNDFGTLDVANYFYWVEHGNNGSCLTRSYYNAPPIVTAILDRVSTTDNDFIVYPNPVNDVLTISTKNWISNAKVEVIASTGVLLDSKLYSGVTMPLDFAIYASGIYWVKLTTPNSVQVLPIVKR